jgi:integrase
VTPPPDWREPRRRCLPLAEWPARDQELWRLALQQGDLLLDDGPGAALRPATLRRHRASYGRWLAWLAAAGRLDPDAPPGARATPEAVGGYVAELQGLNAPGTVLVRLQSLGVVLRWFGWPTEQAWFRRLLARLQAQAHPVRDKRARLRRADELLALGRRLMAQAEAAPAEAPPRGRARLYRDGLMIAVLACRPLRLGNLIRLELGRQLARRGAGWWLELEAAETKTGQPIALPFPDELAPALERYLATWRPLLARPDRVARSRALWLTQAGRHISPSRAALQVARHTGRAFGRSVNPHGFRDAAATTVALARPEAIGLVTPLLGHRALGTAQRHYNLARMTEAAGAWHGLLDELTKG